MDPLKKRRRSPLYIQLKEIIRAKIEDGEYAPALASLLKISWLKHMESIVCRYTVRFLLLKEKG